MRDTTEILFVVVCVVGLIAGGIYIFDHVTCWNFFGMAKGCVVAK